MKAVKSLDEQIIQDLAREMAEQMDFDVMADLLGWIRVELSKASDRQIADDVFNWVVKNCKGQFQIHKESFIFEDPKDASHFILRWK